MGPWEHIIQGNVVYANIYNNHILYKGLKVKKFVNLTFFKHKSAMRLNIFFVLNISLI